MTRLLCATDLLPKSQRAVERAGLLAQEIGGTISLLHVVSPAATEGILEQSLQIATARLRTSARPPQWRTEPLPNVLVRTGSPGRLILDTIEQQKADILIVGPHRSRGIVDGTIAQKILSARKCPLLIVQGAAGAGYRKILVALDLSRGAAAVVRAAESLLCGADAQAVVVHAHEHHYRGVLPSASIWMPETTPDIRYWQGETAAAVRAVLRQVSADFRRYEIVIAAGNPVAAILRAIEIHQPDLLIMGTRGDGPVRRALLGSVANQLVKEVECDVMVVPRGSVAEPRATSGKRAVPLSA
ncbi:MAG: universal stress protein [Steroidobacteraceae bacterium]